MAPSPIRIAVLEADVPINYTRAKYGSYGAVFTSLLHKAADAWNIPRERLEITGWDVINSEGAQDGKVEEMRGEWNWKRRKGYPKMEDVDAVLITGSRYNAFDNDPWVVRLVDFVKEVLAQSRVRVIGVCYGHQIVGRALGAKVARSEAGAWEVSVSQVNLTEKGKELFGKDALSIHQMHKDLVYYYPEGVEELGSSGPCKVQGMYVPKRLVTVQGHPEFTEEIVADLLENRHKLNIFPDGIYEDGMARVGNPQDGVLVAQAFLKFVMED
ncbi:hypothetical protein OEA41_001808 [Lepraria neglecta]|uniref:Glutamine amidotransferase domain-containing protein n=1 Tax=Lepraria neglecta TaxID=209136 RepID=A0AAD9ZD23_9LECA|nr:hypothetical protein OEA41_001808 [Lepraria neglecta]